MNALQLRIGRTLLAASHCGQQTFDFIEEEQTSANQRFADGTLFFKVSQYDVLQKAECFGGLRDLSRLGHGHLLVEQSATFSFLDHPNHAGTPEGNDAVKLLSLNVARPRLAVYQGRTINTGIFKLPVSGPVPLRTLNLDGDRQADLSVHGGPFKAVYGYPSEHYPFWREKFPDMVLPWGMFGENFTTEGLLEGDLHIGDRLQVGSAILVVRQPRMPCYKLAAKFQRDDILDRFLQSGRSGFYFSVEQEGVVQSGDTLELLSHEPQAISIAEMNRVFAIDKYNLPLLEKAVATPALPEDWRDYLAQRLPRATAAS